MFSRSANQGNANNVMNTNVDGNVNNTNAWNANTYAPIVLRRALWPTHSAGCPEDYRQGAEIPGESLNNTADNRKRQCVTQMSLSALRNCGHYKNEKYNRF